MQIKYVWGALLSACIAFTGCSDDVLEEPNVTPWQEGDNIIFGARAGFQSDDQKNSRTVYKGEEYEFEGKKYERVDWVVGDNPDEISVLCPEAKVSGGGTYADYKVTSHKTEPGQHIDYATFVPAYYGKALQWGSLDQQYHFYAVYPSVHQMTDPHNPDRKGVEIKKTESGVEVVGTVPIKQKPWVMKKVGNQYTGHPMMRNAIMTATSTLDPKTGAPINLSFKSLVTALELEFVNNDYEDKTIMNVMIRSKKHNLAGKFSANLTNIVAGYPSVELLSTEAIHQIIIPLTTKEEGTNIETGLKLRQHERLKLTAFILPIDQLDDLEIVVKGLRGERSHALSSQQSGFKAHLKHYVSNINLPKSFKSSRWMSLIDDNVYLSQLSIPGTGNSYSYNTPDDVYLNTQSLSILQQWDLGIRCFEVSCGHAESSDPNYNLGNISLQVGKTKIPGTVSDAVRDIYDMVQDKVIDDGSGNPKQNPSPKPTEFAMVIMNYQPIPARNPEAFLKQFTNFYNSITKSADPIKTKLYKPNLTLGEVRGNILFVLRPSSDGEDDIKNLNLKGVPSECLVVNGWGSLHDKWKQRGYVTPSGAPVFNCAVEKYAEQVENTVEQLYLQKESDSDIEAPTFTAPKRRAAEITYDGIEEIGNYTYETNQGFIAWAQEWSRVVKPLPMIVEMTESQVLGGTYGGTRYLWTHWFESYDEKLNAAKSTFKRAVANKKNISEVYFNSLCGYFVEQANATPDYRHRWSDGQTETKKWGPAKGNIIDFSNAINLDFYNFMQGEWDKSISGPMGVIIMNHVGLTDETGNPKEETFLMPDMVISNNFTFGLIKSDSTPTPEPEPEPQPEGDPMTGADGSYAGGEWLWK